MKETILSLVALLLYTKCEISHLEKTGDTVITSGNTQIIIPTVSYTALSTALAICNDIEEALLLKVSPEQNFLNEIEGDVTFSKNAKRN